MHQDHIIFVDEECIDEEKHIIATYEVAVERPDTLEDMARTIGYDPTIGTWTHLQTDMEEALSTYCGKVLLPLPRHDCQGRIRIAIPLSVVNPSLGGIPHLMALLGAPFGLKRIKMLRLANIEFPSQFTKAYAGPRFGLEGIYQQLGLETPRPLLATMLKPRSGLSVQAYAQMAQEALCGGIDIIFDDELMVSPQSAPFAERVPRIKEAVVKSEQRTGERKLYAVNITSTIRYLVDMALWAKSLGADVLYVNPLATGISALEALVNNDEINLPILCCRSMHGVFQRSESGIDMYVLLKLARLAGADGMHIGSISGKLPHRIISDPTEVRARARVLTTPAKNQKPIMPILSGGMHPGNLEWNVQQAGMNVIVQAGSGVLGHPAGPRAGGKAMRDALEAVLQGQSTLKASLKSKELCQVLETWGYLAKGEMQDVR